MRESRFFKTRFPIALPQFCRQSGQLKKRTKEAEHDRAHDQRNTGK
jgi:hypothetical protein